MKPRALKIYNVQFTLIFLKWTTRSRWSNIRNCCRSSL